MTGAGITIIRNAGRKPLSKSFKLKDGKLHSEVAAQMSAGTFESRYFEHIDNFSSFLTSGEFGPDTAIAYGMNPAGKGYIAAQDAMNEGTARKGAIARTKENFPYRVGEPGILFGDIDPLAGHEFEDAYHYDRTLYAVVSWWKPFRRIYVPSSSSEIYEEATDKLVSRKAAFHVHGLLDDASQAKPVTDAIFAALIEAGYGRVVCLKNGARVLRSIIDRAVPQGERLDFAFGAHLGKGLRQERFILPMGEQDLLQTGGKGLADFDAWRASSAIVRKLMAQAEPEAKAKKGAFIDEKVEEAAGRGVDRETARRSYERAFSTNSLPPDHLLYPRHGSPFTVGEAVTHPDDYHGMAVCDPLESDYGVTGILYLKGQRVGPTLHSQAHGGQTFRLMAPEPTGKTTHMAPARPAPVAVKGTPVEEPIPSPQPMAGGSNVLKVDLAPKPEARSFASIIQEINELAAKGYDAFDHLTVAIPTEMAAGEYSAAEIDAIFRAIGKAAKCSPASVRKVYTAIRASLQTEQFGGESLDLALARRVLKEHYSGGEDAIYSRQAFRFWNGSYWEEQDNVIVRKHLVAAAEGMGAAEMVRKALIESSMALFNIEAARNPEVQFNPDIGSTFINVANGELHLVGDCWQLRPAKRGHYRTSQIPVVYDPNAVCPVWDGLLESLFRGDDDAEMKRRCLMQMFGYSLLPISAYDRFAILIGAGANGKSVVLNVLRALLGRKNVSAVQPRPARQSLPASAPARQAGEHRLGGEAGHHHAGRDHQEARFRRPRHRRAQAQAAFRLLQPRHDMAGHERPTQSG